MAKLIRVAIIGGGVSGLIVARHLSAEMDVFAPTIFEQTDNIGGTWVYTDRTGIDEYGLPIHSSMYKNLRINLPKELMAILDFPFPKEGSSYLHREDILLYLQNYCKHFQLLKYITAGISTGFIAKYKSHSEFHSPGSHVMFSNRLSLTYGIHDSMLECECGVKGSSDAISLQRIIDEASCLVPIKVICVKPLPSTTTASQLWSVEVENVKTKERETQEFDKIVIATGNYHQTRYVDIPGLEKFTGTIMHSHSYRVPDSFTGRNVLCIGAGSSGIDISIELSCVAKKVGLCHDLNVFTSPFPSNLEQLPWPVSADAHGFHFKDGRYFHADDIIFCTGYEYDFDYLDKECGLSVVQHRVTPLYKHLIHLERPSMAIMNVPFTTVPFVVCHVQAQLLVKVFKDPDGTLPTTKEMALDTDAEFARRASEGYKPRHFHKFALKIWQYLYDLVEEFKLNPVPITREKLHHLSFHDRLSNLCTFRDIDYATTDTDAFYRE